MKKTLLKSKKEAAKKVKLFFSDVDGTLTDGFTYYSKEGETLKRFNHKDGTGVHLLRLMRIGFGIITTENSPIARARAAKLKADFCFIAVEDKLEFIRGFLKKKNMVFSDIAFIGDDINDIPLIQNAGLSFAVGDASPRVKKIADYVCKKNGGFGGFREAVEIFLQWRK